MKFYWSSQRAIANSKIVKTSAIWLVLVPLTAKVLGGIDEMLNFTLFNAQVDIKTTLPFSWQLLFLASVFFTIAGIIYSVACPEFVKRYTSFTEFEADGKTRMQILHALKKITWDRKAKKPKDSYLPQLHTYFKAYSVNKVISREEVSSRGRELFDDINSNEGKNSNAFYFVYELSDSHTQPVIALSFIFYVAGFASMGVIGVQNFIYVAKTFG